MAKNIPMFVEVVESFSEAIPFWTSMLLTILCVLCVFLACYILTPYVFCENKTLPSVPEGALSNEIFYIPVTIERKFIKPFNVFNSTSVVHKVSITKKIKLVDVNGNVTEKLIHEITRSLTDEEKSSL